MNWVLRLLMKPTYEVRLVAMRSGRNLVGERIYQGSCYKTARKKKAAAVLKYSMAPEHYQVVLKAVVDIESIPVGGCSIVNVDPASGESTNAQTEPQEQPDPEEGRGSAEEPADHKCDASGPLVYHDGKYVPTCSICGAPSEVAEVGAEPEGESS